MFVTWCLFGSIMGDAFNSLKLRHPLARIIPSSSVGFKDAIRLSRLTGFPFLIYSSSSVKEQHCSTSESYLYFPQLFYGQFSLCTWNVMLHISLSAIGLKPHPCDCSSKFDLIRVVFSKSANPIYSSCTYVHQNLLFNPSFIFSYIWDFVFRFLWTLGWVLQQEIGPVQP